MSFSPIEVRDARAQAIEVQEDTILLNLVDGRTMTVPIVWYPRLWYGTKAERCISSSSTRADTSTGPIWTRI